MARLAEPFNPALWLKPQLCAEGIRLECAGCGEVEAWCQCKPNPFLPTVEPCGQLSQAALDHIGNLHALTLWKTERGYQANIAFEPNAWLCAINSDPVAAINACFRQRFR